MSRGTEGLMSHRLSGLDPTNPLAFLAALGTLRVVTLRRPTWRPRLYFDVYDANTPVLNGVGGFAEVVDAVLEDAAALAGSDVLTLAYDDSGQRVASTAPNATSDLKPSPRTAREFLESQAIRGGEQGSIAATYFCDAVMAEKSRVKPTALHFAAGQQAWLKMIRTLCLGVTPDDITEALTGPWVGSNALPSLAWDATATRQYALRATDPSLEKRPTIAGANWLAFRGLSYLPVHVSGGRLVTTAVRGGWKDGTFIWPLWGRPVGSATVAAVMRIDHLATATHERRVRGIHAVQVSRILRAETGGYGSFTPSVPR